MNPIAWLFGQAFQRNAINPDIGTFRAFGKADPDRVAMPWHERLQAIPYVTPVLVTGNVMQVKVAKAVLGIDAEVNQFYFKFADGIDKPDDIMDYYVSGKSLPMGRLSFRYLG